MTQRLGMHGWLYRGFAAVGVLVLLLLVAVSVFAYLLLARVEGAYFDSNGVRIHYTDEGPRGGEPVILVHGLAANADINWRRAGMTGAVKRAGYRVIAYDLRGHGLSGRPYEPEAYGLELVHDVPRLMDHLEIERAHIAGYSLGGFIALKMCTAYPERMLSASLGASGWADPEEAGDIRSPYKPPPPKEMALLLDAAGRLAPVLAMQGHLFLPHPMLIDPAVKRLRGIFGKRLVDVQATRALRKTLDALGVPKDDLLAIEVPMFCVMGSRDGLRPYGDDFNALRPDAAYRELEGANHITTAMHPGWVRGVVDFIGEVGD